MTRPRLAAAALLVVAACPLPQPLPSVPTGSVTPPRIVEGVSWPSPASPALTTAGTTATFEPGCPAGKETIFTITATVADDNFTELVEYRWFVDYDVSPPFRYTPLASGPLDAPSGEPFTLRPLPALQFQPQPYGNAVHVLELVVSNGFAVCPPDPLQPQPLPCRTPQTTSQNTYEVQSHKWVFVPASGCAAATTCPPCLP